MLFRSSHFRLFLVAAIFLLLAAPIFAQSVDATLSGSVKDQQGAVVPGANVTVTDLATRLERRVTTNDNGQFVVPLLPPATYNVSIERQGFATVEVSDVTLNTNDRRSLNVELKVGTVGETVNVTGEASLINESAAQATTIDRTFVANLPLNGRSFQSLIFLTPGVVPVTSDINGSPGQFSVNGQRTNANNFTVDGVGANVASNLGSNGSYGIVGQTVAGTLPSFSALGTTSTLAPVDAVEQFKIQTSTYSAEFGRQPGGQVQIVTRSGGSDFHGSIYDYVRNEAFDANNFFNNAKGIKKPPLRQNQFGGTLSGPVFLPGFGEGGPMFYNGKKRTFFFFAYEGLRLLLPNTVNTFVPSLRLRQLAPPAFQAILNAFPLPTGPETTRVVGGATVLSGGAPFAASFSDPKSSDTYSLRVDYKLTDKMTLFGRYGDTPSRDGFRYLSVINDRQGSVKTLTLGTTYIFSSNFTNDLRFNYSISRGRLSRISTDFGGAVPIDASLLYPGADIPGPKYGQLALNFFSGAANIQLGDAQDSYQRQLNIVDNVSFNTGNHQFRFGLDYRRLMPTYAPFSYFQSTTIQYSETEILNSRPFFTSIDARQGARPRFNNYSFYAEDTWKAAKRLTLSLGLRYDLNPAPYDADGREPIVLRGISGTDVSNAFIAPPGTPFYKSDKTALAPRLGAVYKLSAKPGQETILRGGFGVFYDLPGGQALAAFSSYPFTVSKLLINQPFPLPPAQIQGLAYPQITYPITNGVIATNPDIKLPYTLQYNVGIERSLGKNQVFSVSYVGSAGRRLLTTLLLNQRVGNTGAYQNPNFRNISYTDNGPTSDYNSLQAQYQRRLSRGLQALANYTWSHAIDVVSDELTTGQFERGSASFDVRHNFSAALTYQLPKFTENRFVNAIGYGWAVDSTIYAQSGQPINIQLGTIALGDGTQVGVRPDVVPGQPFWIEQANVPGGRRINPAAFKAPPAVGGIYTRQGNLGRNVLTGPPIYQVNVGIKREFGLYERLRLQLRAEAFNVFNHPQFSGYGTVLSYPTLFGIPSSTLNTSLGGINSLYQLGGPRSMQFSARFFF